MRARWTWALGIALAMLLGGCAVGYGRGYRTYGAYGGYYGGSFYDPYTGLYYADPGYWAYGRPYYRYPYYAQPYAVPYPVYPRGRVVVPYAPPARVIPRHGPQYRPPVVGTPGYPRGYVAPRAHVAPHTAPPVRAVPPRGSFTVPR
jgi:hypothetical protein